MEETRRLPRLKDMWYDHTLSQKEQRRNIMKIQRFAVALTLLNLGLLIFLLAQIQRVEADGAAPVLRARALEIVDEKSKVRADNMPDGATGYPEAVMLRLYSSKGRPNVKIAATEDGSGQVLGGESNPTHIQILARGANPIVKLVNKDGQEQVINP
jgi:hypothetical protein